MEAREAHRKLRMLGPLDQPVADRHAWLVAVCGSDTALLQQVERMLAADEERHYLLDRSADATSEAASLDCPASGCDGHGLAAILRFVRKASRALDGSARMNESIARRSELGD